MTKPGKAEDPQSPKDQLTYQPYANPYLTCPACGDRVVGRHDDNSGRNWPCGDDAGVVSLCPTWSPVDGCMCLETLGRKEHGIPEEPLRDKRKERPKHPPSDDPQDPSPPPPVQDPPIVDEIPELP